MFRFRARDYRRPADPQERELFWCDRCKYGRLMGHFKPSEIASFYPSSYYTHGPQQPPGGHVPFADRLRIHLAWRLDNGVPLRPGEIPARRTGPLTCCDLGCGSGEQLRLFRDAGYQVVGVEPDPAARTIARTVGEVLDGTAESIPAPIARRLFDVVLLSHVLEHCIDPVQALTNANKMLAPTGTLVIEVPNNSAVGFSRFGAAWPWTDIPRHLNFFTERSLRLMLQKTGFSVTNVNYVGYTRQFLLEWIRSQEDIWIQIGTGPPPDFKSAAWLLLLRTAFASRSAKYDSVRVHAVRARRQ
jgi:SAM-dependent methyltransferase